MQAHRRFGTASLESGVRLPYVELGEASGVPVLLLHPWGESLRCFDRLLSAIPETMHVIAMDQRGHGGADKPPGGYALADFATDVASFLRILGLPPAVLVGSSSGGYVAQHVAVDCPDRVAGLVLVGSPRSLQRRPPFADEVEKLTDPIPRDWVEDSLTWFPLFHEVPDWYVRDRVDDGMRMPAHVWAQALAGLSEAVPPTDRGTIIAPTLIIWGERDELLSRADQEALASSIPDSRLVVYDATGHLVLWEQPERVAGDLTKFVERLSSA